MNLLYHYFIIEHFVPVIQNLCYCNTYELFVDNLYCGLKQYTLLACNDINISCHCLNF